MNLKKLFSRFSRKQESYLRVSFTSEKDQQRVLDFYNENTHKHVDARKPELRNQLTKDSRIIIVDDNDGNIGFISCAYDFDTGDTVKWMEIGSTMNQQDPEKKPYDLIKGISLYPSILASQTIHEFLCHTPEDKIVACIFDDNAAVIHMLNNKVGWEMFTPEDDILKATKQTKDGVNAHEENAGDVWLQATTNTLPHQARMVLDFIDQGETEGLLNKKSQTNVRLDTSDFSLANEFRAAVEALAYGPLADKLENSPHMGMHAARDLLEQHLNSPLQSQQPVLQP